MRLNRLMTIFLMGTLFPVASLAQSDAQARAARETYIPEIQLLHPAPELAKHGIHFAYVAEDTSPGNGKYFCGGLKEPRLSQAANEVSKALAKLPAEAWNNIDLKYLLLCSVAKAQSRTIGGIPVPPIKLLMLSVGQSTDSRLPYTTLHELYHMVEFQHGAYNDAEWNRRFEGYDDRYGSVNTVLGSGGADFINAYGKSFPHEERAELFAIRMYNPRSLGLHLKAHPNQTLVDKVLYMQQKCADLLGSSTCN